MIPPKRHNVLTSRRAWAAMIAGTISIVINYLDLQLSDNAITMVVESVIVLASVYIAGLSLEDAARQLSWLAREYLAERLREQK